MIRLHEIETGTWIVPELVTSARVVTYNNGMYYEGYAIELLMAGGSPVVVRRYRRDIREHASPPYPVTADDWTALGLPALAEIVAWIDERRIEPLELVRA